MEDHGISYYDGQKPERDDETVNTFNKEDQSSENQNNGSRSLANRLRGIRNLNRMKRKQNYQDESYQEEGNLNGLSTFNNDSIVDSKLLEQDQNPQNERLESQKVESDFDNIPMNYGVLTVEIDPATERNFLLIFNFFKSITRIDFLRELTGLRDTVKLA